MCTGIVSKYSCCCMLKAIWQLVPNVCPQNTFSRYLIPMCAAYTANSTKVVLPKALTVRIGGWVIDYSIYL